MDTKIMLTAASAPIRSDSVGSEVGYIQCSYVNNSTQLQVVRISNIPGWRLEQVVSPGQELTFKALSNARLEVYANKSGAVTQVQEILCSNLEASAKKPRLTIA
jgi:Domain of unknown function (DUF1830)